MIGVRMRYQRACSNRKSWSLTYPHFLEQSLPNGRHSVNTCWMCELWNLFSKQYRFSSLENPLFCWVFTITFPFQGQEPEAAKLIYQIEGGRIWTSWAYPKVRKDSSTSWGKSRVSGEKDHLGWRAMLRWDWVEHKQTVKGIFFKLLTVGW